MKVTIWQINVASIRYGKGSLMYLRYKSAKLASVAEIWKQSFDLLFKQRYFLWPRCIPVSISRGHVAFRKQALGRHSYMSDKGNGGNVKRSFKFILKVIGTFNCNSYHFWQDYIDFLINVVQTGRKALSHVYDNILVLLCKQGLWTPNMTVGWWICTLSAVLTLIQRQSIRVYGGKFTKWEKDHRLWLL